MDEQFEYKGYVIQHIRNSSCADFDLPEGQNEAWRVWEMDWRGDWMVHTAASKEDAMRWVDDESEG